MKNIQVNILNPEAVKASEKMMVFCARLTQRGHKIKNMADLYGLLTQSYKPATVKNMCALPHPTIQKFGVIHIAVVGASRRFLAQITRHQNEVKFMSASLQYSDYSDEADFCIPYEMLEAGKEEDYLRYCKTAMEGYKSFAEDTGNDPAGYAAPQGLRNILIISATPFQLKHMISQRVCHRNTTETKYVMLKIWEALYELSPEMFNIRVTGAGCQKSTGCQEGKMCCGKPYSKHMTPTDILRETYPLLISSKT
jgi:thymidylate synthase (FAD)